MNEPNLFGKPEFLKDLKSINNQSTTSDLGQNRGESQAKSDVTDLPDAPAPDSAGDESRLNEELAKARIAIGATGAAIALVCGETIVCHANSGSHVPDIGARLNPHQGLSGSCIQTRQLQQCSDTEMDARVDSEACRSLGVRSIVVLPLIDGNELFGILEMLSSRPNAFGPRDLDILKSLADRIIEGRRENRKAATMVQPKEIGSLVHTLEEVVRQYQGRRSESGPGLTTRQRTSRINDLWTAILVALVIGVAALLGGLVGFRHGRQGSNLARRSSPTHRENAASKMGQTALAVSVARELQPVSASVDECDQPISHGPSTEPPRGGLTICQHGRVIFSLPHSALSPIRDLQTSPSSPDLERDLTRDSQAH